MKSAGSSIYTLGKQLYASVEVVFSTMLVTVAMSRGGVRDLLDVTPEQALSLFRSTFIALGTLPVLALFSCFYIDNSRALSHVKKAAAAVPTETEFGVE